jgi:hypothetical protein
MTTTMKKLSLALVALSLSGLVGCDADIDKVQPSRQVIPTVNVSELPRLDHYIQLAFAKKYNVDIAYRYDDKVTDRRYLLAPIKESKALEYLNLIDYMFFQVYAASTPEGYLQTHTIKYLNLFGSSGYAIDRRMAGAAPQGMIWIYNINELNTQYTKDVRENYISTLFHESAHTLHEERAYPPEFDKLSSLEYQKQDAFSYWWRTGKNAGYAGFVSDYASTDADEDFAELFAYYVLDSDSEWAERLKAAEGKNRTDAKYTGREIIEKKVAIMKAYLHSEYSADLDKIRAEAQKRLPKVATMDFTQYPKGY